jgi:hypothetical protein
LVTHLFLIQLETEIIEIQLSPADLPQRHPFRIFNHVHIDAPREVHGQGAEAPGLVYTDPSGLFEYLKD